MRRIDITEAQKNFRELVAWVESGKQVVITRKGRAVAQLVPPIKPPKELPSLKEFRKRIGRRGASAVKLLREERSGRHLRVHWMRIQRATFGQ